MSSNQNSKVNVRLDDINTSQPPYSLQEAQPSRTVNNDLIDDRSAVDEQILSSPAYVEGWKLHMLMIGLFQGALRPPDALDANAT
jgi:hypothetical protein